MSVNRVVTVTVGRRDLQVLARGPRGLERLSTAENTTGTIHRHILAHREKFRLWGKRSVDENKSDQVTWENDDIVLPKGYSLATAADLEGAEDAPADTVWLFPGLLHSTWTELVTQVQNGEARLCRVLLFHTDRGERSERAEREPVAAGPVLRDWMAEQLPQQDSESLRLVACLGPGEQLTHRDTFGNTRLNSQASQRIDQAIRQAAHDFPDAKIRLHASGGIPALSEVVHASARLHFGDAIEYRNPTEDGPARRGTGADVPQAVEVLDFRRRAVHLLRQGEFQAAARLAEAYALAKSGDLGVAGLQALSRYFEGYGARAHDQTRRLPVGNSQLRSALLPLFGPSFPFAFVVALRAEAALRANDILAAATATVTFYDVVLFDAIDRFLRRHPNTCCVDWVRREINRANFLPTEAQVRSAVDPATSHLPEKERRKSQGIEGWLNSTDGRISGPWLEHTLIHLVGSVGGMTALSSALTTFANELHAPAGKKIRPSEFRNSIVHSLPTDDEIEDGIALFESRNLWLGGPPRHFLHAGGHAAAILAGFGVADPLLLYNRIVEAAVSDLLQSPFPR